MPEKLRKVGKRKMKFNREKIIVAISDYLRTSKNILTFDALGEERVLRNWSVPRKENVWQRAVEILLEKEGKSISTPKILKQYWKKLYNYYDANRLEFAKQLQRKQPTSVTILNSIYKDIADSSEKRAKGYEKRAANFLATWNVCVELESTEDDKEFNRLTRSKAKCAPHANSSDGDSGDLGKSRCKMTIYNNNFKKYIKTILKYIEYVIISRNNK